MGRFLSVLLLFGVVSAGLPAQMTGKPGFRLGVGVEYLGMSEVNQDSPSLVDARTYQNWFTHFLVPTVSLKGEWDAFDFSASLGIPLQLESELQQWQKKWSGSPKKYDEKVVYSSLTHSNVENTFSLNADLRFLYGIPLKLRETEFGLRGTDEFLLGARVAYSTYGGRLLHIAGADYFNDRPIDYSEEGNNLRSHLIRPMVLLGLKLDRDSSPLSARFVGGISPITFYANQITIEKETVKTNSVLALAVMLEGYGSYQISDVFALYAHVGFDGVLGGKGKRNDTEDSYLFSSELKMGLGITLELAKPEKRPELKL